MPISLSKLGIAETLYVAAAISVVGLVLPWALAPETRSLNL
ncbi:Permease of the major facilitator superfamily [Pseudomonas synxantha]|uniref:Permease of the major facilitator superfamily n=1 Tax=Pseudomonas synxantha TaxID=47883 RepID=A0A3G7U758_9PSED|nr:Permease of the major facilitator superfamily [Pseudomonas synxantha]